MTIDEVLKEFRELLSQYTGEAITGHYNEETQQKMESLFFQAEARGKEEAYREGVMEGIYFGVTNTYDENGREATVREIRKMWDSNLDKKGEK